MHLRNTKRREATGLDHPFMAVQQNLHHIFRFGHALDLFYGTSFRERLIGTGCGGAKCQNALSDLVNRGSELRVMFLKHEMRFSELRPRYVPVKSVLLQVKGVRISQQALQAIGDLNAVLFCNTNINVFHLTIPPSYR
jgi:hypothetical protein